MFLSEKSKNVINRLFIQPVDFDSLEIQTREKSDEPFLVVTIYKENQIIYYQNYEYESSFMIEEINPLILLKAEKDN